jgi:hypothetical protein
MLTTITASQFLTGIYAAVGIVLLIVLYHALFIVVDMRKIMRRAQEVSEHLENVIVTPLTMMERGLEWLVEYVEGSGDKHKKHAHAAHGHKHEHHEE